jgi:hypothetical protein
MSGGDGVLLASSHALMSLVTPQLGLQSGGWIEELCMLRWMLVGIDGIAGIDSAASNFPDDGAVFGRWMVAMSRSPPWPWLLLGWIDGSFRSRRCSHCFAVSCLPEVTKNASSVGVAVMFYVAGGATGEDVEHRAMCDNGDVG